MSTFEEHVAAAVAHHRAGRLDDAEAAYRAALALAPARPSVLHNFGVLLAARGRHDEALAAFETAIAGEPGYAAAHYNRGVALAALGRPRDAIAAFEYAGALEPGHYEAHRALGFLWLAVGNRDRALDHFARTCELRRGEDRTGRAARSLDYASRSKLAHDAAQFRYLSTRRRDGQRFELLARIYEAEAQTMPEAATALSPLQIDRLGEDYNTPIAVWSAPEIAGPTVNAALDAAALTRSLREGRAGAVVIDDLLSAAALASLQRFLLESTIWHDFEHIDGFVASYLEDGLACPLLLQIADELRRALPELLGPHPLSQAWAFKGLVSEATVAAHADDAEISINLWLTPDAANLDPERGGLQVCRVPPPAEWEISGYDTDMPRIEAFLEQNAAQTLLVPYACNRAVLFESRLFHRSDVPRFAAEYEGHRINLTLLFGRRSQQERRNLTRGLGAP